MFLIIRHIWRGVRSNTVLFPFYIVTKSNENRNLDFYFILKLKLYLQLPVSVNTPKHEQELFK